MSKEQSISYLRSALESVVAERKAAKTSPERYAARTAVRRFQANRMAETHADLLADPNSKFAATFFLTDLYGPHDFSERDANLQRALPSIAHLLPEAALATVGEAITLDALSEKLDAAMADRLGTAFSEQDYIEAYRAVGARVDREAQLAHVDRLGDALCHLVALPLVGKTLTLMKTPARIARVSELQSFLERGFKAFQAMDDPSSFTKTVIARERRILNNLYSGKRNPFGINSERIS